MAINKNLKNVALGFHGVLQVAGAAIAFIGFRSEASEVVAGYLFVTGVAMCVLAYNRLIVKVYLRTKLKGSGNLKALGKAGKLLEA